MSAIVSPGWEEYHPLFGVIAVCVPVTTPHQYQREPPIIIIIICVCSLDKVGGSTQTGNTMHWPITMSHLNCRWLVHIPATTLCSSSSWSVESRPPSFVSSERLLPHTNQEARWVSKSLHNPQSPHGSWVYFPLVYSLTPPIKINAVLRRKARGVEVRQERVVLNLRLNCTFMFYFPLNAVTG